MTHAESWEYRSILIETKGFISRGQVDPASIDQQLNALGAEGWEVVEVTSISDGAVGTAALLYTLKRPMGAASG